MNKDKFTHTVTENEVDKQYFEILKQNFEFSARFRSKIKRENLVRINGKQEKMFKRAKLGDVVSICLPSELSNFEPEDIPFEIVFEDQDLLIINKPAGYVVHPTAGHPCHTMANGIMNYILKSEQSFKIRFINRLDMDTTGLLIIGKNGYAQEELSKQMKEGKITKTYLAIVNGIISGESGTIDLPIGRPDPIAVERAVMENGSPSITHFRVIERFKAHTLLELVLETGRTHQIRVHMSHMGHALLSDPLYGNLRSASPLIERQALHAAGLSFYHPISRKLVELSCALPTDFKNALKKLRE